MRSRSLDDFGWALVFRAIGRRLAVRCLGVGWFVVWEGVVGLRSGLLIARPRRVLRVRSMELGDVDAAWVVFAVGGACRHVCLGV